MKKRRGIVVVGPESSGKTTLAAALAEQYHTRYVPEYARAYLDDRPQYSEEDLLEIAKGQIRQEKEFEDLLDNTSDLLIYDTDLMVIKVWSAVKYGRCHPWILDQLEVRRKDLYLVCFPDLPWKHDVLRESPNAKARLSLFELYRQELTAGKYLYHIIRGHGAERTASAVSFIEGVS